MRLKIILSILLLAIFFSSGYGFAEPIAVIVNKSNPIEELSLHELKTIYEAKKRQWPDGRRIIPINREYAAGIRGTFSRIVHGKSPEEMKSFWYERAYKGVRPPMTQESSFAVKRFVANMAGAIGYIYLSEADETVKIIKIDGIAPDEEGYKIKD